MWSLFAKPSETYDAILKHDRPMFSGSEIKFYCVCEIHNVAYELPNRCIRCEIELEQLRQKNNEAKTTMTKEG